MPLEERAPAYLWDMLDAARAIVEFTQELTRGRLLHSRRGSRFGTFAAQIRWIT